MTRVGRPRNKSAAETAIDGVIEELQKQHALVLAELAHIRSKIEMAIEIRDRIVGKKDEAE